jgi:hypothetical protein
LSPDKAFELSVPLLVATDAVRKGRSKKNQPIKIFSVDQLSQSASAGETPRKSLERETLSKSEKENIARLLDKIAESQ